MITKEQALTLKHGKCILQIAMFVQHPHSPRTSIRVEEVPLEKPRNWKVNGQVQTWVTRPNDFRVPLKHGLYSHGELTHENCHLFELI